VIDTHQQRLLAGVGLVLLTAVVATWATEPARVKRQDAVGSAGAEPRGKPLLPIFDPAFNVREVFKQLVLLEDHLTQPRKRCPDCIWKHLLTAEALAEEAATLDAQGGASAPIEGLAERIRDLQRDVQDGLPPADIAQRAREIRKGLLETAASVRTGGISDPNPRTVAMARSIIGLPEREARARVERAGFVWMSGVRIDLFMPNAVNAMLRNGVVDDAWADGEDVDRRPLEEQLAGFDRANPEHAGALGGGMILPVGGDGPTANPQRAKSNRLPAIGYWRPQQDMAPVLAERAAQDAEDQQMREEGRMSGGRPPGEAVGDEDLPWPADFVDRQWDPRERDAVAKYLDAGKTVGSYRGWSTCRLCGKHNGSQDLSDGSYVWPQGFSHYVRDHSVRPPVEFVQHALGGRPRAGQIPGVTAPIFPQRRKRYGPTDASLIGRGAGASDYDLLKHGYDTAGIDIRKRARERGARAAGFSGDAFWSRYVTSDNSTPGGAQANADGPSGTLRPYRAFARDGRI